jgi:hypothetical protein
VYKLDSFVGFTGDEQLHAQECYDMMRISVSWHHKRQKNLTQKPTGKKTNPKFVIQ